MTELPQVVLLSELPTIITHPGFYRTRDGRKVFIREIDQRPNMISHGSAAKGGIEAEFRGRQSIRGHYVWHVSGRYYPLNESKNDIVGRWEH